MDSTYAIDLQNVCKTYRIEDIEHSGREVRALQGVDLKVARGEFLAIVGRSGCGKSTLLNLLGGLDAPDSGQMCVVGQQLETFDEAAFTRYRRDTVGIVFQFFNLLPLLTVLENAALPALLAGKPRREVLTARRKLVGFGGFGRQIATASVIVIGRRNAARGGRARFNKRAASTFGR